MEKAEQAERNSTVYMLFVDLGNYPPLCVGEYYQAEMEGQEVEGG